MATRMSYEHRIVKGVHQLVRPLHTADREDQSKIYVHAEVFIQTNLGKIHIYSMHTIGSSEESRYWKANVPCSLMNPQVDLRLPC